MADRDVETYPEEVPEIPEIVEQVLLFALNEGKERMEGGEEVTPFSVLVVKDNLFIETHPGDTADECFNQAKHTVEGARGAMAYAFCYDGYVETDEGDEDVLIAEGGLPGEEEGYAVGILYHIHEDGIVHFDAEPVYIGEAPNFMEGLKAAEEYAEDEIAERYTSADEFEEVEDFEDDEDE